MSKKLSGTLVIVESPTKAKTISQFLGRGFSVESSYGHIRDLPSSKLGIDVEHNFEPHYITPRAKSKRVKELKKIAEKSIDIILATDEDREGEAIAWHLATTLNIETPKRIVFHEITRPAIEEALKHPRALDMNLINAQQARRVLDRLVGYKLSPFLWKKVMRGLSAGRVQSVALRLIVERERERQAFTKEEYWTIEGSFKTRDQQSLVAHLWEFEQKTLEKFDITTEERAKEIQHTLEKDSWHIERVEKKKLERSPLAPFTTSTLQQEASRRLRFSAKQTMMIAQQLYEGIKLESGQVGLITYMRTDSTNLSRESQEAARTYIEHTYGAPYALSTPRVFKKKAKGAQEAHEAIRPTDIALTPEHVRPYLDARQYKLYDLIWRRFTASQMPNAVFDSTSIDVRGAHGLFRASGQTVLFDGFLKVWPSKSEEAVVPHVNEKDSVSLDAITPEQHFTEPPARYSEASLVKILEKFGIGRPSTYAPTMSTLTERGYVTKDTDRRFTPTEVGMTVNDILVEHFPEIVDIAFTAKMEEELDGVADGSIEWVPLIKEFYEPFEKHLESKYESVEKKNMIEETNEICEKCGKPMILRYGRFGRFMACSGFPDCKNTKALQPQSLGMKCPECHEGNIVERRTRQRRIFFGCSRYPDCTYATWKRPEIPDTQE